jgi:class 3 adenylate cyclase
MFCDLVGSTAPSAQYDPEDLSDIVRTYQDACAGIISRYEGYIARYMGDGMLVYFGYPQAHEDDAERALRTGLEIIERASQLRPRADVTLQTRVGIATGLVVVGDYLDFIAKTIESHHGRISAVGGFFRLGDLLLA